VAEAEAEASEWSWYSDGTVERELGEELRGAKAIRMDSLTKYRCGGSSLVTRVSTRVLLRQMAVVEHLQRYLTTNPVPGERLMSTAFWRQDVENSKAHECRGGGSSLVTAVSTGVLLLHMKVVEQVQRYLTTNPVPGERLMSTAFWRQDVENSKAQECYQPTEADIVRHPDSAIARSRHCKWMYIEWQEHGHRYNNYDTYHHPAIWYSGLNPRVRFHISQNGSEWRDVQSCWGGGCFAKRGAPVDIDLRLLFRELSGYTLEMKSNARLQEDKALVTIEREKEDRKKRMVAFVVAVLAIAVATAGVCLRACNIII
jgi:hypothetical protein